MIPFFTPKGVLMSFVFTLNVLFFISYLIGQLNAFRSGDRTHNQMSLIARQLSDEDIADLARWFEAIEVTATAPELE